MKKTLLPLLLTATLLSSCNKSLISDISYQQYIETVNSKTDEKQIYVFTLSSCPHCQLLLPLLEKYIQDSNVNYIYKITLDSKKGVFVDETIGKADNSKDNHLLLLDKRIADYAKNTNTTSDVLFSSPYGLYEYIFTPLIIWYDSGIEVKICNKFDDGVLNDEDGSKNYESFVEFISFPESYPQSWNKEFDLTYYTNK